MAQEAGAALESQDGQIHGSFRQGCPLVASLKSREVVGSALKVQEGCAEADNCTGRT